MKFKNQLENPALIFFRNRTHSQLQKRWDDVFPVLSPLKVVMVKEVAEMECKKMSTKSVAGEDERNLEKPDDL